MNCNTTHYRANSSSVPGDPTPYFDETIRRASALGYAIDAWVLDAFDFGVPQRRERLFIVGVLADLGVRPRRPEPHRWRYSVRDALPHLARVEGFDHKPFDESADLPLRTLCASTQQAIDVRTVEGCVRPIAVDEMKALCGVPRDFVFPARSSYEQIKARLGNCVTPPLGAAVVGALRDALAGAQHPRILP